MKLKEYRINKGYTQQDMAEILGITQQSYSNKEAGKRGFNAKELLILQTSLIIWAIQCINTTLAPSFIDVLGIN